MFPKIPKQKKLIYLDHAAATPLDTRVEKSMKPFLSSIFANPSSLYSRGVEARKAVDAARQSVAGILAAQPDTIIFTSGGTESNNLTLSGVLLPFLVSSVIASETKQSRLLDTNKTFHIITTKVEHDSVLRPIEQLEKQGFDVTYLDVDEHGFVIADQVKKALRKDTILVSVMYANNEIGTIQPIAEIGREILKWRKQNNTVLPLFHTDAAQAAGALDLSVEKLHVDLMSLNGSKIYGPKGVGILYKRRGVSVQAQSYGGRQEFGMRAGTENVPGIVGCAKALELAQKEKENVNKNIAKLRDYFWTSVQKQIPDVALNGPEIICHSDRSGGISTKVDNLARLPNNLNISFTGVEAEALMLYLDSYGIMCSTGSACSTDSSEPSHVLKALGYSDERASSSLRFTLGKDTTKQDVDYVMKYLSKIVENLRKVNQI